MSQIKYLPMCFQISPGTINTSTITSMLISGITRDQVLSRKVVCDLTLWLNGYSICCNTCLKINFLLPKTNNYSQPSICFCERGTEIQPQYFLSVQISSLNNADIICPDFCERLVKVQSIMSNFAVIWQIPRFTGYYKVPNI